VVQGPGNGLPDAYQPTVAPLHAGPSRLDLSPFLLAVITMAEIEQALHDGMGKVKSTLARVLAG
jgi:hypothetical protein